MTNCWCGDVEPHSHTTTTQASNANWPVFAAADVDDLGLEMCQRVYARMQRVEREGARGVSLRAYLRWRWLPRWLFRLLFVRAASTGEGTETG